MPKPKRDTTIALGLVDKLDASLNDLLLSEGRAQDKTDLGTLRHLLHDMDARTGKRDPSAAKKKAKKKVKS